MSDRSIALRGLGVVFAANFLNYLDRQLVSALEGPLRRDLRLDEPGFGLLWTLFTIGYMVCAVPIGFLADRSRRPRLFAVCIAIWSVATVASGLAETKLVLHAARFLTGVGEAGCLVIGPALVSDLFSKEARGRALSVFYLGLPLGGTAAFILAGLLFEIGWRKLFLFAGLPGFAVAAAVALMPDPPRGGSEGAAPAPARFSMRPYLDLLRTRTLVLVILAQAFAVVTLVPIIHFGVKFFEDTHGMGETEARVSFGLVALVAGAAGNALSGVLGDWLARRFRGAYALLAGVAFLGGWPFLLIGFYAESRMIFLPAITAGCFLYFVCMPAVNTQIANVSSPAQRATAWALAVFAVHLLGDMLAPPVFGVVSAEIGRRDAFALFSFAILLAGLCCLLASRTAGADAEKAAERVSVPPPVG